LFGGGGNEFGGGGNELNGGGKVAPGGGGRSVESSFNNPFWIRVSNKT